MSKEAQREAKLQAYMRQHRQILEERKPLIKDFEAAQKALLKKNKEMKRIGQVIYDLKHSGETPLVTDHAIVRYLERVEGVDINDLKIKVSQHSKAQRVDNVIVTVMEDYESPTNSPKGTS